MRRDFMPDDAASLGIGNTSLAKISLKGSIPSPLSRLQDEETNITVLIGELDLIPDLFDDLDAGLGRLVPRHLAGCPR